MDTTRISSDAIRWTDLLSDAWPRQQDARPSLSQVIDRLRRRWRLRLLLNGLCLTLAMMIAVFVACAWLLNHWHFTSPAVWSLRFVLIITLVGLLMRYCLGPLRCQVSDARVALYLQEHEPSLGSILLSAVDARLVTQETSPRLVERLAEQAIDACAGVGFGHAVERLKLRQAFSRLGLVLLVMVALLVAPPEFIRMSATALLIPWTSASEYSPYRIELSPGDIEIARGDDQLISAKITGFDGDDVILSTSTDAGVSWQSVNMARGTRAGVYESFLFDLNQPLDYHVSAAGRQSATYRIDVADIPTIAEISLLYRFPAYTQMPPEISHGSGDIVALRGTRVQVRITPSIAIPGGALLLNDGQRIELVNHGGEDWNGDISVDHDSGYRVRLERASGIPVDASVEFRITALDDRRPAVSILSPGRDTKVSMIEEPLMQVRATDDQGIARLELVLSVNGADAQRIDLAQGEQSAGARRDLDAEHILYLEELKLNPGDLISYYVQAEDSYAAVEARSATSDIFFYQVRPFDMNYHRADQQGGGGGGAQGGQQQGHLSDQQKQFVVATFKMIRDRDSYDSETWQQNLELLARAQARIRDRVEAIVRRLGNRPMIQSDARYRVITTELPLAAEAMMEVEKQLQQVEIEAALADAQIALVHLQRADAAFRDINVSLASQGSGGAGSGAGLEDLADLFRLEMDKLSHQYESVQHGQRQSPAEVIDETLERLRELAQRQQREVERQLRRQGQATDSASSERQLALAEALEEMLRQLERLTREQPNPQLQQSIEQMKSAAAAMRSAAANAGGGAAGQARQAVQKLHEARRLLDQGRERQFSDAIERSLRRAELAEKRQSEIRRGVSQLDDNWGDRLKAQLQQLDQRKQALDQELLNLESELSELAVTAREEQPQANQPLKQAIQAAHDNRLHDRIGRTRDMVQLGEKQQAIDNENKIQQGIAQIREHIETALSNVDAQGKRGLQRSLERMRELARELQSMRARISNGSSNQGAGTLNPGGAAWSGNLDLRQQLQDIGASTAELGQHLLEIGIPPGDIDPVLDKMEALTGAQAEQDIGAASELHDQAIAALMELEFNLRRQSKAPDNPEPLMLESGEIPHEFKAMVADYFRKLSEP